MSIFCFAHGFASDYWDMQLRDDQPPLKWTLGKKLLTLLLAG